METPIMEKVDTNILISPQVVPQKPRYMTTHTPVAALDLHTLQGRGYTGDYKAPSYLTQLTEIL